MATLEKLLQVNETGCLLVYQCFKGNCKIIAIDLSKQQALDADPKIISQINFTRNLECVGNITMSSQMDCKSFVNTFYEIYSVFYLDINTK